MNKNELEKFKDILNKLKKEETDIKNDISEDEIENSYSDNSSELSVYDNHPSDTSDQVFEKEKFIAIKSNQTDILDKIDKSLSKIEDGSYGKCELCGKNIPKERLESLPYAEYCIDCEKKIDEKKNIEWRNKDKGFESYSKNISIDKTNWDEDENEGYVEPVEKVSNRQYKEQWPK